MCGNFGLVQLGAGAAMKTATEFNKPSGQPDELDKSLHRSLHEVSKLHGLRVKGEPNWTRNISHDGRYDVVDIPRTGILPLLTILRSQISSTEVRGGQAGGISTIEFKTKRVLSKFDAQFRAYSEDLPIVNRVRCVARKRYPLAADLINLYERKSSHAPACDSTITFVGHTRFATASINRVPELHPHEWVPFHNERVWVFSSASGKFSPVSKRVGIHLSHNGDFDALEAYSKTVVVSDVGLWLERVLHTPNDTKGDSPKVAGCMDLFRVQGRWAAAARLAYLRVICKDVNDVCGGEPLTKSATNTFPPSTTWEDWASFFEVYWQQHRENVIKVLAKSDGQHRYKIDLQGEHQMVEAILLAMSKSTDLHDADVSIPPVSWSERDLRAFIHHSVRGFLRADLYAAMTEVLSKAHGSFGLQVHCTLEPGVVVIASKGQPMSLAFDPKRPLCLFGSEAEAVAVPVDQAGQWLPLRLDLDSNGEVV